MFPAAVRKVKGIFSRNERVVVHLETEQGPLDVVLVGAFGVGRITLSLCDLITNTGGQAATETLDPPSPVARGELLGVFHLGSTVVLAAPEGRWNWTVEAGEVVQMGQVIARRPRPAPAAAHPGRSLT